MPLKSSLLRNLILSVCLLAAHGCGVYSFTGTNLPPDVKSISILTFANVSGSGPSTLSQTFSEKMRDYFQRNTSLSLVPQQGDLQFDGTIVGYELSPLPPSANDVASQTRLTIRIKANYQNLKDETQNFDETFSFFADFPSNQNLASVESDLIQTITDQIIIQMFNKSVANW